jgi:hypothetical protein
MVRQNFRTNSQQSTAGNPGTEAQVNASVACKDAPKSNSRPMQHTAKPPILCFECAGPHKKSQCPKLNIKATADAAAKVVTCITCEGKGNKSNSPLCEGKAGQKSAARNIPRMCE